VHPWMVSSCSVTAFPVVHQAIRHLISVLRGSGVVLSTDYCLRLHNSSFVLLCAKCTANLNHSERNLDGLQSLLWNVWLSIFKKMFGCQ
jgi:hypothetical protein